MRQLLLIAAAAASVLAFGNGTASAQGARIEIDTGPRYDTYRYNYDVARPGPRVYGYYSDDAVITEPRVIVRPANCGEYRYWNGSYCADARLNPPDLD
jgi:hypothetical protein